jgi:hypothetical protein
MSLVIGHQSVHIDSCESVQARWASRSAVCSRLDVLCRRALMGWLSCTECAEAPRQKRQLSLRQPGRNSTRVCGHGSDSTNQCVRWLSSARSHGVTGRFEWVWC